MLSVFLFLVPSTVHGTEVLCSSLWKGFVHAHMQISKQTCTWHTGGTFFCMTTGNSVYLEAKAPN